MPRRSHKRPTRTKATSASRAALLPRLEGRCVEFVELIDVRDDGRELAGKQLFLALGQFQIGQLCDLLYFNAIDGHLVCERYAPFLSKHLAAACRNCARSASSLIPAAAPCSSSSSCAVWVNSCGSAPAGRASRT